MVSWKEIKLGGTFVWKYESALNMQSLRCLRPTFFLSPILVTPKRQYPGFLYPTANEERTGKNLINRVV